MKIILTAVERPLYFAWKKYCENINIDSIEIKFSSNSILGLNCDAVVSPANSFGFMDGGIDAIYSRHFTGIQNKVQDKIKEEYYGELLVGQSVIVETRNEHIPYLIAAPTMRVPTKLGNNSINPYLAARSALRLAKANSLESIAFPGLGTGVGGVSPEICALQMKRAIESVFLGIPKFPKTWKEAQNSHQYLYRNYTEDLQYK